jgi:hypothetical protein
MGAFIARIFGAFKRPAEARLIRVPVTPHEGEHAFVSVQGGQVVVEYYAPEGGMTYAEWVTAR